VRQIVEFVPVEAFDVGRRWRSQFAGTTAVRVDDVELVAQHRLERRWVRVERDGVLTTLNTRDLLDTAPAGADWQTCRKACSSRWHHSDLT
jgi:hypothetical protein